jgi:hypothetical protein
MNASVIHREQQLRYRLCCPHTEDVLDVMNTNSCLLLDEKQQTKSFFSSTTLVLRRISGLLKISKRDWRPGSACRTSYACSRNPAMLLLNRQPEA